MLDLHQSNLETVYQGDLSVSQVMSSLGGRSAIDEASGRAAEGVTEVEEDTTSSTRSSDIEVAIWQN